ncbi:MAG: DUF2950 domain-containing protein [Planctomycetes bacterium]|nr:DUF2950 domain-containing protein [Planctomycetota bacterium]
MTKRHCCALGLIFMAGATFFAQAADDPAIASNEEIAIVCCEKFGDAQRTFCRTDWDEDKVLEYATSLRGDMSLYEKTAGAADIALIDRTFAMAEVATKSVPAEEPPEATEEQKAEITKQLDLLGDRQYGKRMDASKTLEAIGPRAIPMIKERAQATNNDKVQEQCEILLKTLSSKLKQKNVLDFESAVPKSGYLFRVLTKQGPNAVLAGGEKNFITSYGEGRGGMTMGFALVAFPAEYGKTGRRTFLIGNIPVVYAKDLGEKTREIVSEMDAYNPDKSWTIMEERNR